jgi:hypothetical protein
MKHEYNKLGPIQLELRSHSPTFASLNCVGIQIHQFDHIMMIDLLLAGEYQENATGNECWLDASGRKRETENH